MIILLPINFHCNYGNFENNNQGRDFRGVMVNMQDRDIVISECEIKSCSALANGAAEYITRISVEGLDLHDG